MPTSRPLPPLNPVSEWLRVIPLLLLILLVWGLEMSAAGASLDFPVASYLAVHSAFEVAAVVLAAISFGLLWMAPGSAHRSANGVLAASLAAAAGLDFLHLLSYNGMPPLVTPAGVEKGIAFWLAGRTMMTVGLLAMAFLPAQREISRARRRGVLAVAMAVAGLCAWVILYHPTWLPVTHVAGQGLTGIKVGAELALIGLLLVTGWRLDRRARRDNDVPMAALATASVLSAAAELCFATYFSASDVLNGLGHLAKILAYWNIVRATYLMAVSQPLASVGGLADALQATLSPALLCRPSGQIRWINDAMSRATGYALADLQG
ncbi:MAG TPA: MASE3 domain-containing protein, partial [Aquabacterium sp.]|nr:MASE3 domain-containing protein [Aquabacterium sp.]